MAKSAKAARRPRRARNVTAQVGYNGRQRPGPRREQSVDFLQTATIHQIVVRRVLDRHRRIAP